MSGGNDCDEYIKKSFGKTFTWEDVRAYESYVSQFTTGIGYRWVDAKTKQPVAFAFNTKHA